MSDSLQKQYTDSAALCKALMAKLPATERNAVIRRSKVLTAEGKAVREALDRKLAVTRAIAQEEERKKADRAAKIAALEAGQDVDSEPEASEALPTPQPPAVAKPTARKGK